MDDETRRYLDALMVRINDGFEHVGNKLTEIRDDITVAMGTADQVRRVHDNTRDEVRGLHELLSIMQKQILRLEAQVSDLRGKD